MKRYNRRAQFFLLAAVVIAAIVLSLGVNFNKAEANEDLKNLYGFTYDVKSETGEVVDFQIFNNLVDDTGQMSDENLRLFVNLVGEDLQDKYSDADFIVLYGNKNSFIVENHGGSKTHICCSVNAGGICVTEEKALDSGITDTTTCTDPTLCGGGESSAGEVPREICTNVVNGKVNVRLEDGSIYSVDVSDSKEVVFIIRKAVNNEIFVAEE